VLTSPHLVLSRLAAEVASRLGEVVSEGFTVTADDTTITLSRWGETWRSLDLSLELGHYPDEPLAETAARASLQVLRDVQDDVIETIWTAWPEAAGRSGPARAYSEVENGRLRLGYVGAFDLEPVDVED